MAKTLHLSKLSRGHVEMSESGSRLEIFADHTVRIFLSRFEIQFFVFLFRKDHLFVLLEIIN
jgi:hypothetical protein